MKQVQKLFNYKENPIRTVDINGTLWFIAKDICSVLDLGNVSQSLTRLDEDEKSTIILNEGSGNPVKTVVNEPGLYSLIMTSRKPEAREFKRWIRHEVLPSIRKHGAYMTESVLEDAIGNPDFMIGLLESLKEERRVREQLEYKVAEDLPKVSYYDTILSSNNAVNISQIAEDYGLSGAALNKMLHEEGVQYRRGEQWLLYRDYKNKGYTKSKTISIGNGSAKHHTQWTQKGRVFIHQFLNERGVQPLYDCL